METSERLIKAVQTIFESIDIPADPKGLYAPIAYTLSSGGKRLRPLLLLAGAEAFGAGVSDVINQCIGIEMFHNFTLLHDDVMDNSAMRRGRPTVHTRWNVNTAILSGDAMLTMATMYMARCCSPALLPAVLETFNATAMEVYEGQQLDMDFETRADVSVAEYIKMIRLKTSVLLGASLKIGALMGGASPEGVDALYNYGVNLGLGFQLRDDWLDTFGDPKTFGKVIGGDILNDKKTWLRIKANERGAKIPTITDNPDRKIQKVTEIYRALGLDEEIQALIMDYSEKAIDQIRTLPMNEEIRTFLIQVAEKMAHRNS